MKHLAALLFSAGVVLAQAPPAADPLPIPLPAPTMLPRVLVSIGGGYASPNGKFAYFSESTEVLPQQTYATVVQEYTLVKNQVQSCTFGGLTKPLYQVSVFTGGITGLGGGCTSSSGDTSAAGSGQAFVYVRWGHLPFGNVITVRKNTNTGWKVTLGFSWGKD